MTHVIHVVRVCVEDDDGEIEEIGGEEDPTGPSTLWARAYALLQAEIVIGSLERDPSETTAPGRNRLRD